MTTSLPAVLLASILLAASSSAQESDDEEQAESTAPDASSAQPASGGGVRSVTAPSFRSASHATYSDERAASAARAEADDEPQERTAAPSGRAPQGIQREIAVKQKTSAAASGGSGGSGGAMDPALAQFAGKRVKEIYEHHKDMPRKQGSYGIFTVANKGEAVAVGFYTPNIGGRMEGHYCGIVKASTNGALCLWQAWVAETPGGKPLCGVSAWGDSVDSPGAVVLTNDYTRKDLDNFLTGGVAGAAAPKFGPETCILNPAKKYYCHVGALGWPGEPGVSDPNPKYIPSPSNPCLGLKFSSPYDNFEMSNIWQASRPR